MDAATALNRVVTVGTAQLPTKPNHILLSQLAASGAIRDSVDKLNETVENLNNNVETLGGMVMVSFYPGSSAFYNSDFLVGSS